MDYRFGPLSKLVEDQHALWRRWKDGDKEAARPLLEQYAGLINSLSHTLKRRAQTAISLEDCQQLFREEFLAALGRFDSDWGPLPAYMRSVLTQRAKGHHFSNLSSLYIPNSRPEKRLHMGLRREQERLGCAGFTDAEVRTKMAEKFGVSEAHVDAALSVRSGTNIRSVSHYALDEDGDTDLVDDSPDAATVLNTARLGQAIEGLMERAGIPDRSRELLRARFWDGEGAAPNGITSHEYLAQNLGLSRERVRRIIMDALDMLREQADAEGLSLQDLL